MKLKQCNAALSLLSALFLLLHIGYWVYTYLTFTYAPDLEPWFSVPLMVTVCLHAVLGMCAVFLQGDGAGPAMYPRKNRRTVVQRVSAALFFPLLILHLQTFDLLTACAVTERWFAFGLLIAAQLLFYGVVFLHASVSLTRALITLGWLSSRDTQRRMDRVIYVFGALLFAVTIFIVIRTQLMLFLL